MPENRQLTTADWNEAKKLLTLSEPELHKLGLDELREGAALLRAVGDLCVRRSRGLHKLADGREAVGAVDSGAQTGSPGTKRTQSRSPMLRRGRIRARPHSLAHQQPTQPASEIPDLRLEGRDVAGWPERSRTARFADP